MLMQGAGKMHIEGANEANIQVIVLKGAAFVQTRYEDLALRPMNDLV